MDAGSYGKDVLVPGTISGVGRTVAPSPAVEVAAATLPAGLSASSATLPAGVPASSATLPAGLSASATTLPAGLPASSATGERSGRDGGLVRSS